VLPGPAAANRDRFAARLGPAADLVNAHVIRWRDGDLEATLCRDGRLVVRGTADRRRPRAFVDRGMG